MIAKKIPLSIFIALSLATASAHQCSSMYTQPNMRLNNNIFKTVTTGTSAECLSQCFSNSICLSINYHQGHERCELNQGNHLSSPVALLPSHGYVYAAQVSKSSPKCSNKLCSEPYICVTRGNNYACVKLCEASGYGKKNIMKFPRKSTADYVQWENPFGPLNAFTISLWVQLAKGSTYQAIFSYSSVNVSANSILIQATETDITVMINDDKSEPQVMIMDGIFHHVALTWLGSSGQWNIYINGTKKGEGVLSAGENISKGAIILGQDQDSHMGGFEEEQSLQGNLTDVNVWSRVLTGQEIADQYASKCSTVQGNIVKWVDFLGRKKGQVEVECRSFCG